MSRETVNDQHAATNRRTTDCADANGNICPCGYGAQYTYDVANPLVAMATNTSVHIALYSYAPNNQRVWRGVWVSGSRGG